MNPLRKSSDSVSSPGKQHDQSVHVYISFLTFHALSFENLSSLSLASASSFAVGPPLPPDGSSMDGRLTRVICTGRQQSKVFQSKRANQLLKCIIYCNLSKIRPWVMNLSSSTKAGWVYMYFQTKICPPDMQLVCKLDYIDMKYLSIPLYKYYSCDSMAIGHKPIQQMMNY